MEIMTPKTLRIDSLGLCLRLHSDWVKNGKLVPFFDQNIVNNDDVIYGHCVDGQKFYVVEKGSKIGQVFRF